MGTLVLGSGISALTYLLYNRDAFCLAGEHVGGLFAATKNLGPQYLWYDKNTAELIELLGLPDDKRFIKIGYFIKGELLSGDEISLSDYQLFREQYAYKTRGTADSKAYLSQGAKTFPVFNVTVDQVVTKLVEIMQPRMIHQSAKRVDLYRKVIHTGQHWFEFDNLISTIQAPKFCELAELEHMMPHFEAHDKMYATVRLEQVPTDMIGTYDYIYVSDPNIPFHRVKFGFSNTAVLEYTIKSQQEIPVHSDTVLHPKGQIVRGGDMLKQFPSYIQFLGRYAEWRPGVKLNQVLETIHG